MSGANAFSTAPPTRRSSSDAGTAMSTAHAPRRPRGVRRRRDDNASAVEIEELDSDVMRQNSYNYFQLHGTHLGSGAAASTNASSAPGSASGNPNEATDESTAATASSRKRQRTLTEQLDDLCLNGAPRDAKMSGAAAAAACRQAWNRVFKAQMVAAQQRAAAQRAAAAAATAAPSQAAPPPPAAPVSSTAALANGFDVDMDGNSAASSAAEDGEFDDADNEDSGRDSQSFKVVGGVPDVKDVFFGSNGARQRPMERMFRHYVSLAAERSSRGDGTTTPRGDELVLFQQGPTSLEFPYSLFTPEQVEDLRARHNRKKRRDRFPRSTSNLSTSGASSEHSWRFQELDSSDEADVSSSAEDSDMDMSGEPDDKGQQHAGALSHGEWFMDVDDLDSDSAL